MTERPTEEPEPRARLTGRDRLLVFVAAPFFLLVVPVELVRVWKAVSGGTLLIFGLPDPDVTVRWSESPWWFAAGLLMHAAVLVFAVTMLSGAWTLARRRLRAPRR